MKLDSKALERIIREVLVESNGATDTPDPSTLAGGSGVQRQVLKKGLRDTGDEFSQLEELTPQEGKIVQRYIGLLQKAAKELSIDKGALYTLLNTHFKKLAATVDDEMEKKSGTPDPTPDAAPTEIPVTEQCGAPISGPAVAVGAVDSEGGEGRMAKSQLYKAATYAAELEEMIQDGEELDGWVQAKITKASDYLSSVKHYLEYKKIRGN